VLRSSIVVANALGKVIPKKKLEKRKGKRSPKEAIVKSREVREAGGLRWASVFTSNARRGDERNVRSEKCPPPCRKGSGRDTAAARLRT